MRESLRRQAYYGDVAATRIDHARTGGNLSPDAFEDSDGGGRDAIVIAELRFGIVGVGADHRNGLCRFGERKQAVLILEQDYGFARRFDGELPMRRAVIFAVGDLGVFHERGRVEHPELETRHQQPPERLIDLGFLQQSGANRRQQIAVLDAAIQIGPRLDGFGHTFVRIG